LRTAALGVTLAACLLWALAAQSALHNKTLKNTTDSITRANNALLALADSYTLQAVQRKEKVAQVEQQLRALKQKEQQLKRRLTEYLKVLQEAEGLKDDMEHLRSLLGDPQR